MSTEQKPAVLILNDLERVRVLAEPMRLRILRVLHQQPATVKQIADAVGAVAGRIHYHVKELERHGLIVLSSRQEKGSIIEKYYTTTADSYAVDPLLFALTDEPPPTYLATAERVRAGFVAAHRQPAEAEESVVEAHVEEGFRLTAVQARELLSFITATLEDQRSSGRKKPTAPRYTVALFVYPSPPPTSGRDS